MDDGGATHAAGDEPVAPLGHLYRLGFELRNATSIDQVARSVLLDLGGLAGVRRVGLGLLEGAGRRVRYVATEHAGDTALDWCHIDAYDDVPLTTVTRTGESVTGSVDDLEGRYPGLVARQRDEGTRAIAAWPLPGPASPIGGLVVFFDEDQTFDDPLRRLFEATARRTADAVRRIRLAGALGTGGVAGDDQLGGTGVRASIVLEGDPRAPGAARRFVRQQLDAWEVEGDVVDTAQLCVSELVTNAVMHAGTSSELSIDLEAGVLTVVVRDLGGPSGDPGSYAPVVDDDDLRVFGRGLTLVDAMADRWGSVRDASGTTAWFVLSVADVASSSQTG
nr:ATP-binding protein [Nocardioides luti]